MHAKLTEFEFEWIGFDTRVYPRQTEGRFDAVCCEHCARDCRYMSGEKNFDPRINNRENGVFRGKSILNIVK